MMCAVVMWGDVCCVVVWGDVSRVVWGDVCSSDVG